MKRVLIISGIIAAFLCLAQNANAQYAGPIHRQGAHLADMRGNVLTDHEAVGALGPGTPSTALVVGGRGCLPTSTRVGRTWGLATDRQAAPGALLQMQCAVTRRRQGLLVTPLSYLVSRCFFEGKVLGMSLST